MVEIVFQVGQIATNLLSSWSTRKHNIILFKVLTSVFSALMMLCVGQLVGAMSGVILAMRSALFMYKDKFKTSAPFWSIVVVLILFAIFTVRTPLDILPILTSISTSAILWYCKPMGIKVGLSIADSAWAVYYLVIGLYLSGAFKVLNVIVSIISAIRIKMNRSYRIKIRKVGQTNEHSDS